MNVEIVEFYPIERDDQKESFVGTLRIKLPDLGLHILGVYASKRKQYWRFVLPGRREISSTTGEPVWYPFVAFDDKEQQRALIEAIQQQAPAFIERRIVDTEKPITWPQRAKKEQQSQPPKKKDIAPKLVKAVESQDLPQRKPILARSTSKYAKR